MFWRCVFSYPCLDSRVVSVWSMVGILCSLAVLVQVAFLIRVFLVTRQVWWHYLLMLIPVGVIIYSFVLASNAMHPYEAQLLLGLPLHWSPFFLKAFEALSWNALQACRLQTLLAVLVYAPLLLVHRRGQTPAWVLARDYRKPLRVIVVPE